MKRIIIVATIISLFASVLYAQKGSSFYKHEVRLSYGIFTLPDFSDYGGFTVNYMYRVTQWFWVGTNINWQFPSELQYYRWREYDIDGAFADFEISERNNFFAIAPELRFSYTNKERVILYSAFSAGYGIHTGIHKKTPASDFFNNYWYWNITFFGANINIGKKQNIIVGGEFGLGFKGLYNIHIGYRF